MRAILQAMSVLGLIIFLVISCKSTVRNDPRDVLHILNDKAFPGYNAFFNKQGITESFSPASANNLMTFIDAQRVEVEALKANKTWKKKKAKSYLKFLDIAHKMSVIGVTEEVKTHDKIYGYLLAKRILYTLFSQAPRINHAGLINQLDGKTQLLKRFALKLLVSKIPYENETERAQPLSAREAKKEAAFLVDPQDPATVLSPAALVGKNHVEIADLDVSDRHPTWHTRAYIEKHPNAWQEIETWIETGMTDVLKKEHKQLKHNPAFAYKIQAARKVLFFSEIKTTATSPKVTVEDAFGVVWKLKWGEESQTESVANRLWVKLGGKYNDLVYTNGSGESNLVLILNSPVEKERAKPGECVPVTREDLRVCLLNSVYKFNVAPYVIESGPITEDNATRILGNLSSDAVPPYQKAQILNREENGGDRHYVIFKENMIEFKPSPKLVDRGGPTAFSAIGALDDRVARGLFLFNMWINNRDAKDDNNRGVVLTDYLGQKGDTYVEMQHDLGVSFGGISASGFLNRVPTGEWFLSHPGDSGVISFNHFLLYMPNAWKKTTFSDALWMAKKIVNLPKSAVTAIVSETKWPDFMQETFVYLILARRNQIASVFNIEPVDEKNLEPNSFSVPLGTVEAREAAAAHYNVAPQLIHDAWKKAGLREDYIDKVVVNGKISDCYKTVLIGILQREHYPTGLSTRMSRLNDDNQKDRGCTYGQNNIGKQLQKQLRVLD